MAIVLPALPNIVERFSADYSQVQLVVSGYLLGVACAQPVSGFLCDRFGRRPVMLTGLVIFILASIGCSLASSLSQLVTFRVLQAVGASTGTVASRAIVRDVFSAEMGTRALSYITMGLGVAPVIAPIVGGGLLMIADIDVIFLIAAGAGLVVFISIALRLPETRGEQDVGPQWSEGLRNYGRLLRSRPFIGYTLVFGFVQGSFFAFLAVGAAVFQDSFGMGPTVFGIIWGGMAIAYVFGAMLGGRLSVSTISANVLPTGMLLTLLVGAVHLVLVLTAGISPATVLLPIVLLMALSGAVTPLVMAGAVHHHPDIAGTSAGLSSALGLVIGNVFVVASGLLYDGNFLPIAILIAISTSLTAASWLIIRGSSNALQRPVC